MSLNLNPLPPDCKQRNCQIMVICLNHFLQELIPPIPLRISLNLIERVLNNVIGEDALNAWYHHQIIIEDAILFDFLQDIYDEKIEKFRQIGLPQIREKINLKRLLYQEIMTRFKNK